MIYQHNFYSITPLLPWHLLGHTQSSASILLVIWSHCLFPNKRFSGTECYSGTPTIFKQSMRCLSRWRILSLLFSCACPFGPLDGPPSQQTQRKSSCSQQMSWDEELVLAGMPFAFFLSLCQMMTTICVEQWRSASRTKHMCCCWGVYSSVWYAYTCQRYLTLFSYEMIQLT